MKYDLSWQETVAKISIISYIPPPMESCIPMCYDKYMHLSQNKNKKREREACALKFWLIDWVCNYIPVGNKYLYI